MPSLEKLPALIDTLITAVRSGELSVIECFETDGGVNYRSDRLI